MKRRTKLLSVLLTLTMGIATMGALAGCDNDDTVQSSNSLSSSSSSSSTIGNPDVDNPPDTPPDQDDPTPPTGTEGLTYSLSKDKTYYTVMDYTGADTNIYIPNTYKGLPVKAISSAFYDCNNVTEIIIANGIISINNSAFNGCSSLTSITIPASVTSIDGFAFYGCSKLTSIVLPNGITALGDSVFDGCSSLTEMVIPDSVTSIGVHSFSDCSNLANIEIPNGVTSIGDGAFFNCNNLTNIIIPNSVAFIGDGAFYGCSNLQYTIKDELKYLGNAENPYVYLAGSTSSIIEFITEATIQKGCKCIGDDTFNYCRSLKRVEIPDSVVCISNRTFWCCSSLTEISVDENNIKYKSINGNLYNKDLTMLIRYAVNKNDSSFSIPSTVTSINDYAFSSCDS